MDVRLVDDRCMVAVSIGKEEEFFPYVWLRDSCQCPDCWHPTTRSRLFRMEELDVSSKPKTFQVNDGDITIIWNDGHRSVYTVKWLERHSFRDSARERRLNNNEIPNQFWGSEMQDKVPSVNFDQLMTDDNVLYKWITTMEAIGIFIIKDAGSEDALQKLADRIAYIRKTNYGAFFAVKSKPDPNNLAYTTASLGLHTDMPYYEYVPGVQMLHCVVQKVADGGDNEFSDGFYVAQNMAKQYPEAFQTLTKNPADFYDVGKEDFDFHMRTRKPIISLDSKGTVVQVNYNNAVRDTVLNLPLDEVGPFYKAMKLYCDLLNDKANKITYKLTSGEIVCFHNYRVLHGRRAYKLGEGGERHLVGGYLDWDELKSARRVLQANLIQ